MLLFNCIDEALKCSSSLFKLPYVHSTSRPLRRNASMLDFLLMFIKETAVTLLVSELTSCLSLWLNCRDHEINLFLFLAINKTWALPPLTHVPHYCPADENFVAKTLLFTYQTMETLSFSSHSSLPYR